MSNTKHETTRPYAFVNGCLHIRKGQKEIMIKGWDKPAAQERSNLSPIWETCNPEFQLVRPIAKKRKKSNKLEPSVSQLTFDFFSETVHHDPPVLEQMTTAEMRKQALDQFRNALPKNVTRVLEKFRVRQWQMLIMFYHDQGTIELAEANPVLAFFLAQELDGDVDRIKSLQCSKMRRRDILALLGFPATKAAVKTLNKMNPGSFKADNWESIGEILRDELALAKSPLNHLSTINYGVLEIVSDAVARESIGAKLYEEVSKDHREKYRGRVIHMIRSAIDMQRDLEEEKPVTFFANMKRLYEIHDSSSTRYRRRIQQLNAAKVAASIGKNFSEPPLPGIPGKIEPITTPHDLVNEGEEQCNCVASYARKVASGSLYIYRVIAPQRATLSIIKKKNKWEIGELEAKHNSAPTKETESEVSNWLGHHQLNR